MEKPIFRKRSLYYLFAISFFFLFYFTILHLAFNGTNTAIYVLVEHNVLNANAKPNYDNLLPDPCSGRYIYTHDLPNRFNDDLVKQCKSLNKWLDMCLFVINSGLGPKVEDPHGVLLPNYSWYATYQFILEMIFRARMRQYRCLTNDSSIASAVYIPFYAGLDVGRHLWDFNISVRDSLAWYMVKLIRSRPEWTRLSGRDHFFVGGKIGADYIRGIDQDSSWGNKLMLFPESKNMTLITIESTMYQNDFAIPYPTYFHPKKLIEVEKWQEHLRTRQRNHLVSFVGAPRPESEDSIRSRLINECARANGTCNLLRCTKWKNKCEDPIEIIRVFKDSVFCLQPRGDSFTRRSIFDSILAGCIPVFFHPASGYAQYKWHFPRNYRKFSMFIPEEDVWRPKVSVIQLLSRVSEDETLEMREEVIRMIPRIVYADPSGEEGPDFEDAFDVAIKGVLDRIEGVRRRVAQGKDPSVGFSDLDDERFNMPIIQ